MSSPILPYTGYDSTWEATPNKAWPLICDRRSAYTFCIKATLLCKHHQSIVKVSIALNPANSITFVELIAKPNTCHLKDYVTRCSMLSQNWKLHCNCEASL